MPTLQPTSVPPSGSESAGLPGVAGPWRPSGGLLVLRLEACLLTGTDSACSLVPLGVYRKHASSVPSPIIATRGPLEGHWM